MSSAGDSEQPLGCALERLNEREEGEHGRGCLPKTRRTNPLGSARRAGAFALCQEERLGDVAQELVVELGVLQPLHNRHPERILCKAPELEASSVETACYPDRYARPDGRLAGVTE